MSSILPIGIEALLSGCVENARLEFKTSWDEHTTGWQILKTLCAFANDLQNLNGGYIVLGISENFEVHGLPDIDAAQKWIRGHCNQLEPTYMPIFDTPVFQEKPLLVLWAPASDIRPHQAPDGQRGPRRYWVRIGSESVEARDVILMRLMQQTARIPFDDRRAFDATNEDLRISLAREFLHDVSSALLEQPNPELLYAQMQLTRKQNGHSVPRNIGLLFFSDDPEKWFRGARIEVVEFADDAGGNTLAEQIFRGPLQHQLKRCLLWLEALILRYLEKQVDSPEGKSWVSYPLPAIREALVNAVYHRSYEDSVEPIKVFLYPNRVEIISYPGPVDGIELEHLTGLRPLPPVPARNRRIGEFLKELKLSEGRGTGLPKIFRSLHENGSPPPVFDFDPSRSYFRITLPAHPEYLSLTVLRRYTWKMATGDEQGALTLLRTAWSRESLPAIGYALAHALVMQEDATLQPELKSCLERLSTMTLKGDQQQWVKKRRSRL